MATGRVPGFGIGNTCFGFDFGVGAGPVSGAMVGPDAKRDEGAEDHEGDDGYGSDEGGDEAVLETSISRIRRFRTAGDGGSGSFFDAGAAASYTAIEASGTRLRPLGIVEGSEDAGSRARAEQAARDPLAKSRSPKEQALWDLILNFERLYFEASARGHL